MTYQVFELEAWQSRHEQGVEINLADSGVLPVTLRELAELGADVEPLMDLPLHYPAVNGTEALRAGISALLGGAAAPGQVLVTVGAAEANAIAVETLVRPGDEVVVMTPSYAQVEGLARNRGARVAAFRLVPERGWAPDLDGLEAAVTRSTRLIALTNPSNPTGRVLDAEEMARIVEVVRWSGAWLLADEVYRGSERLTDEETPSFVGRCERVVAVNSVSKAYGLSGVRVGWIVAPADLVEALWRRHEYATIAAAAPSMFIAELALRPAVRAGLLRRNRGLIRRTYGALEGWLGAHSDLVSAVPPRATPMAFVKILTGEPSSSAATRLRDEAGVLVAPGWCFGLDDHLRIAHALDPERLDGALDRVARVLGRR